MSRDRIGVTYTRSREEKGGFAEIVEIGEPIRLNRYAIIYYKYCDLKFYEYAYNNINIIRLGL